MEAKDRAVLLLLKYSNDYNKEVINGMIKNYRKDDDIEKLNYWNEVAKEYKQLLNLIELWRTENLAGVTK
jgi:hypothetical protein